MCYNPSNPPVESIPALIKSKRKERGLTQRALGEMCGYTGASAERVVQLWEYGKQSVPLERMRRKSRWICSCREPPPGRFRYCTPKRSATQCGIQK